MRCSICTERGVRSQESAKNNNGAWAKTPNFCGLVGTAKRPFEIWKACSALRRNSGEFIKQPRRLRPLLLAWSAARLKPCSDTNLGDAERDLARRLRLAQAVCFLRLQLKLKSDQAFESRRARTPLDLAGGKSSCARIVSVRWSLSGTASLRSRIISWNEAKRSRQWKQS